MGALLNYLVYRAILDVDGKPYLLYDNRPMTRLCATFEEEADAKEYVARKKKTDRKYRYHYVLNPEMKKGPSAATEKAHKK